MHALAAEVHKFRGGGTGVVFARAPGLRKYKSLAQLPKMMSGGGGGGGGLPSIFFPGQFPDIIYIIG